MQSNAGDGCSSGDLRELGRSGNGSQRKIRGADFERALRLDGKHAAVGSRSQVGRGVTGGRSSELIRGARIPNGDGTTWRGAKGHKNLIARCRSLKERSSRETGDLRLRCWLNRRRTDGEIHLSEARGTSAGRTTLAAETNEDRLRAGGGDARGTGVGKAGNAAHGHGGAGSRRGIEQISILRAKIRDDQLRIIGSQSQAAQSSIRRRPAGRLDGREKCILLKIENIKVINVR